MENPLGPGGEVLELVQCGSWLQRSVRQAALEGGEPARGYRRGSTLSASCLKVSGMRSFRRR
jgi:hypothetical protein